MNRLKSTSSMHGFFTEEFSPETNLILHERSISGDFNALAVVMNDVLSSPEVFAGTYDPVNGIAVLDLERMMHILPHFGGNEKISAQQALEDMRVAEEKKFFTNLWFFAHGNGLNSTRVFHHDPDFSHDTFIPSGRLLCSYTVAATEWLRNEDVTPASHPSYTQNDGAQILSLPLGALSRHAVEGSALNGLTPPFIHRSPAGTIGEIPRLMLRGDGAQVPRPKGPGA